MLPRSLLPTFPPRIVSTCQPPGGSYPRSAGRTAPRSTTGRIIQPPAPDMAQAKAPDIFSLRLPRSEVHSLPPLPCKRSNPALSPHQMIRFHLLGIPVEIQPWFWLTLALVGGVNSASTPLGLLAMMLFILAGFISILVHELGHALTGRHFGARTAITLHAFGGYASFPARTFTRTQDFLVTAAGPALQMGLGAIFFAIDATDPELSPMLRMFIRDTFWISIAWAVLNLIPVLPLDGGRLLASTLGPRRIKLTLQISMGIGAVGALLLLKFTNGFLFPIFLALMAYQNWQELQQRRRNGL